MDTVVPFHRRPALLAFLRFVHDRNPFYLLSALCLFTGFRVILGALNSAPGDWKTLLELIVTLNVYEVVTIGLALFLITRRGLRRDGWILLGIEALFLVDLTNLNAELFTAMPRLGAVINAVLFALAMGKILIVTRTLGLRLPPMTRLYIAAQMAFLLGMPGMFRLMRSSTAAISAWQIYSVWWMLALLIVAGAMLVRRARPNHPAANAAPMQELPWRLYILLPLISLVVHLCGQNRVYWVHFQPANVAPLLLALVFVMNCSRLRWHPLAFPASLAMVVAAVLISITPDGYQHEMSGIAMGTIFTPLRISLLGSTAVTAFLAVTHYSLIAAVASASLLILTGLGSDPIDMYYHAIAIARWTVRIGRRLIPETAAAWGIVAIVGAFVLMAIGAVVSLKAPPVAMPKDENPVAI
jgi:hypothetical protein